MKTYNNELNDGERVFINLPNGEMLAIDHSDGVTTIHTRAPNGTVWNVQVTERLSAITLFSDSPRAQYPHSPACGCDECLGKL